MTRRLRILSQTRSNVSSVNIQILGLIINILNMCEIHNCLRSLGFAYEALLKIQTNPICCIILTQASQPRKAIRNKGNTPNRSIAPTESYTQMVGLGSETSSPRIRGRGVSSGIKTTSTLIEDSKAFDVGNKDAQVIRRKRRVVTGTRTDSVNVSRVSTTQNTSNDSRLLQSRLQAKYRKANAMSHTPEPKRTRPERHYLKRSRTPEPKAKTPLLMNGIQVPFLRNPMNGRDYCLVLDLDETLIHFKTNNGKAKFLIRPYTYNFLKNLSRFYEIIIFTAAQQEYADWILNKIDTKVDSILIKCLIYLQANLKKYTDLKILHNTKY